MIAYQCWRNYSINKKRYHSKKSNIDALLVEDYEKYRCIAPTYMLNLSKLKTNEVLHITGNIPKSAKYTCIDVYSTNEDHTLEKLIAYHSTLKSGHLDITLSFSDILSNIVSEGRSINIPRINKPYAFLIRCLGGRINELNIVKNHFSNIEENTSFNYRYHTRNNIEFDSVNDIEYKNNILERLRSEKLGVIEGSAHRGKKCNLSDIVRAIKDDSDIVYSTVNLFTPNEKSSRLTYFTPKLHSCEYLVFFLKHPTYSRVSLMNGYQEVKYIECGKHNELCEGIHCEKIRVGENMQLMETFYSGDDEEMHPNDINSVCAFGVENI